MSAYTIVACPAKSLRRDQVFEMAGSHYQIDHVSPAPNGLVEISAHIIAVSSYQEKCPRNGFITISVPSDIMFNVED